MATVTEPRPSTERATAPTANDPIEQGGGFYRLSLDQYHQIAEVGILGPRDRVVLLDGLLVSKMTKGPRHSTASTRSRDALAATLPEGWHVRKEDPISLPEGPEGPSEPEPDLAVVRGATNAFVDRHPLPAEVALVVEVADSSIAEDRKLFARYAWAGIPIAWLVNLRKRIVEVHADPSGPGDDPRYGTVVTLGDADRVPVVIAGRDCGEIAVGDLLP